MEMHLKQLHVTYNTRRSYINYIMKITIKTLTQAQFLFEISETSTVLDLKNAINDREGLGAPEQQKLIHSGKILMNDNTLASYNIKEGDFVVVMVNGPKKTAASPAAKASSPTPVAAPTQSESSPAPPPAATPASTNLDEATITRLSDMGFPREACIQALNAAFGNGDRAVEYLMSGIPEQPEAPESEHMDDGEDEPDSTGPQGDQGTGALAFLRTQAPFIQMRAAIQQNPQLLQPLLQQLGSTNPDLLHMLNNNQEEFLTLLNETTGGGAPSGQVQIRATPEEKAAIDRLVALGFEKGQVIEAYFACDKDETLAANYLFDSNNWD
ncbi:hypothetical protein SARC_00895 [Sphaeroforma arctica JP610]|uniref:UV excision repair protein RAD23 n=1 Tax=Sphaeroforma arctica JP610 TaxID=667725 RepID=A0A0L0GDG0_9EUKA|nr:hypothetical protein SARC_00895 [Sphaeroforma arctica JP610]KNC86944.1 hypothetical protein SARC_00895 [Sphaeroforma arctica JP610]|eukprot:XP_014160846.1 hypothetical protein SARC_00895 [Sphaeroforma arctica JP610]